MSSPHTHITNAYGTVAQGLLQPLQDDFASLTLQMTERYFDRASGAEDTGKIIHRLKPERFAWLKQQQAQYLARLLSDDLTQSTHLEMAARAGRGHMFTDVQVSWLVEAYGFYQEELRTQLRTRIGSPETREAIVSVISQRFLRDIEGQVSTYRRFATEITAAFSRIDQILMSTDTLTDLIRETLEMIGHLPGNPAVFFGRMDATGVLQIEQTYSEAAEQYHRAMEAGDVPKISIDPTVPSGMGPSGLAWRKGEIIITDTWLMQDRLAPWIKVGEALGFRSNATVPLLDGAGHTIALLSVYGAWPGYFSTWSVRGFMSHLQQVLSLGVQQRMHASVVPLREQQHYRVLLSEGRVVMHYQPVIHLHDGRLAKIEGLARLRHQDGELIPPDRFLPALGRNELLRLFELGLTRVCEDLHSLQAQGLDTQVAINLPADGLDDPRYEQTFFDCLQRCHLPPDRFQIEVLETQETGEKTNLHKAFLQRLQASGVNIAQDDLGSGHSSLLRLDQYPFDEIKLDQGLVRGALHNPKRAIDFILHLTRLAHAFDTSVTVEGLENEGMIEAAAILGADQGQGYGISKPMPADQLVRWHQSYTYRVDVQKPRTAIGALAGYMLWDRQLAAISGRPELAAEFVEARSIVEQYINANHLQDSRLEQLLTQSLELLTTKGSDAQASIALREQLIRELTDHWLNESS